MNTKRIRRVLLASILLSLCGAAYAKDAPTVSVSPEAALLRLKTGNARFVTEAVSQGRPNAARREATAKAQHPFAIIVTCADSRTAPELVFDQNIGDIFVVRSAGNVIDDHALGGIEFAVKTFGTRLIVVLGHQSCGAVKAALTGDTAPGHIGSILRDIQPAVTEAKSQEGDLLTNAIKDNARLIAAKIGKEAELGDQKSEVRIVSGYYELDTGHVEWLESPSNK
jgi:carbonic anhydrase